jgi:hypothetical protein
MKARFSTWTSIVGFAAITAFTGCGMADDSLASDPDVSESVSDLSLGPAQYDNAAKDTLCNPSEVGGVSMHCCPDGMAMIGIHVNQNVLKCAPLLTGFSGRPHLDADTNRNGMHACPFGQLMVGIHVARNFLACRPQSAPINLEFVDSQTTDSFPMHVCPNTLAMAGIHVGKNLLTCDQ